MNKTIAIVCAMKSEAQPMIDRLEDVSSTDSYGFKIYSGNLNGNKVIIGISGVGMVNMASLVTYLATCFSVDCFVNYGIIGGYGHIHKDTLMIVEDCININSTQFDAAPMGAGISLERGRLVTFSENIDNAPVIYNSCDKLMAVARTVADDSVITGRLGSGDIWNKEYDKIMLFYSKYQVCGEDMEGYAMYQAADRFNIPAISLKGVSNNEILGEKYDYSVMEKLASFVYDIICKI